MKKSFNLVQISCLFILSTSHTWAETSNSFIVYSTDELQEHKRKCKENIVSNPLNRQDSNYQMERALLTITADDADYIPKVIGAGEIFNDGIVPYQLMHNGVKVVLHGYYDVKWMTDVIYALKGHHEPQEEKCFYEILKYIPEKGTMIELGSYWAYYSLWFASQINNAKNYLIEPDPKRLEMGRRNFELNNKTGIFKRGFFGTMHDTDVDMKGVDRISIDDFIESAGIEHVNILHADIQAAEYDMLKTIVRHLDNIDYFFISTHSDAIHRQCLDFFKHNKFAIVAEHSVSQSCSADGLIVAKREGVAGPDHIAIRKY